MTIARARLVLLLLLALATSSCASVPPVVSLPSLSLADPSFFPTLEAYTGAPIVGGNRVTILRNGDEIFPAHLAAIRAARRTITYSQYFFQDGDIAGEVSEALAERCRAGVGVSLLLDGVGSFGAPSADLDLMRRSGCHVEFFRPLTHLLLGRADNRNHQRIIVVDGRVGFTGGSGISDKWKGNGREHGHWRDTDVMVEGPIVQYLQAAFAAKWLETTGIVLGGEPYFPPLSPVGTVYAQVVTSSPAQGEFAMYTTFLLAIGGARHSIEITNPYFVPDSKLTRALVAAVHRGVSVTVLVPGEIDHNLVRRASRHNYGRLLRGGVHLHEYRAALLHAKTMVIDGRWSTIGSTNLDNRSFALNAELNLVVYGRDTAERMEGIFAEDLTHSRRVEYTHWRARPFFERLMELFAVPLRAEL